MTLSNGIQNTFQPLHIGKRVWRVGKKFSLHPFTLRFSFNGFHCTDARLWRTPPLTVSCVQSLGDCKHRSPQLRHKVCMSRPNEHSFTHLRHQVRESYCLLLVPSFYLFLILNIRPRSNAPPSTWLRVHMKILPFFFTQTIITKSF